MGRLQADYLLLWASDDQFLWASNDHQFMNCRHFSTRKRRRRNERRMRRSGSGKKLSHRNRRRNFKSKRSSKSPKVQPTTLQPSRPEMMSPSKCLTLDDCTTIPNITVVVLWGMLFQRSYCSFGINRRSFLAWRCDSCDSFE